MNLKKTFILHNPEYYIEIFFEIDEKKKFKCAAVRKGQKFVVLIYSF